MDYIQSVDYNPGTNKFLPAILLISQGLIDHHTAPSNPRPSEQSCFGSLGLLDHVSYWQSYLTDIKQFGNFKKNRPQKWLLMKIATPSPHRKKMLWSIVYR